MLLSSIPEIIARVRLAVECDLGAPSAFAPALESFQQFTQDLVALAEAIRKFDDYLE